MTTETDLRSVDPMLKANHVHTADVRYDVIERTGNTQAFPFRTAGPRAVAYAVMPQFLNALQSPKGTAQSGPDPEAIARTAATVATAIRQGIKPPTGMDPSLLRAAEYINQGRPFVIQSAGRAAVVRSEAPSSLAALRASQGGVQPGTMAHSNGYAQPKRTTTVDMTSSAGRGPLGYGHIRRR